MSRVADYTIRGFLYQFNKALIEIFESESDAAITVEGIVEDVEVLRPEGTTAIQCKYHETVQQFTPSSIYEPALQMMQHFHSNPGARVRYILFAHYPNLNESPKREALLKCLREALESKNKDLKKFTSQLHGTVDVEGFLSRFSMEIGPPLDSLCERVQSALKNNGIPEGDIDTLVYPNAIHLIAKISSEHSLSDRVVRKTKFLDQLRSIRKTAISHWTMALKTRKAILEAKRKELKAHLNLNVRLRCLVIDAEGLDPGREGLVLFVQDYLDKYHFKQAHISTPTFCFSAKSETFDDIRLRLHNKGIKFSDGFIGNHFDKSHFFRDPICSRKNNENRREFHIRLMRWEDHGHLLDDQECDDLFIIGALDGSSIRKRDVEVEQLSTTSLKELKYLMGVSDVYD